MDTYIIMGLVLLLLRLPDLNCSKDLHKLNPYDTSIHHTFHIYPSITALRHMGVLGFLAIF